MASKRVPVTSAGTPPETDGGRDGQGETTMTTLVGTEKQVTWAEHIRAKQMTQVAKDAADYRAKIDAAIAKGVAPADAYAADLDMLTQAEAIIAGQTSAAWWIDRR